MPRKNIWLIPLSALAVASMGSATASGQVTQGSMVAAAPPTVSDGPAFRDPKTGQVWAPDNVGEDGKPLDPQDRAFDPEGQALLVSPPATQAPRVRLIGFVPVTEGPAVPMVEIDNLSLEVRPGRNWRSILYLQNNSANVQAPILSCQFNNHSVVVLVVRVVLPPVRGGERVGFPIVGPSSEAFVDEIVCRVTSP